MKMFIMTLCKECKPSSKHHFVFPFCFIRKTRGRQLCDIQNTICRSFAIFKANKLDSHLFINHSLNYLRFIERQTEGKCVYNLKWNVRDYIVHHPYQVHFIFSTVCYFLCSKKNLQPEKETWREKGKLEL